MTANKKVGGRPAGTIMDRFHDEFADMPAVDRAAQLSILSALHRGRLRDEERKLAKDPKDPPAGGDGSQQLNLREPAPRIGPNGESC